MGESHPDSSRSALTSGLTSISAAIEAIARQARRLDVIRVPLSEAYDLTLAEPVATDVDYPPFDKSMMDGFAVRSADCRGAPTRLQIVGEVAAGQMPTATVGAGQAVRINTGAPVPPGADAVVMIERVELSTDERKMTTSERMEPGTNVVPRAADAAAGQVVLESGTRLGPAQIGAAAAAGAATVVVYRRPRVSILVTGDELVDVSDRPIGGQIRNSNGPCLVALARQAGCEVLDLGVARDEAGVLREKILAGLQSDLLCLSGGISMGQHDYVPQILREAGVKLEVQKIAIRPGKPTLFGLGPTGQMVFGLPGNPASTFVCFVVFVRAALAAMQGRPATWPSMVQARLDCELHRTGVRPEFLPAQACWPEHGACRVRTTRWTGSGDVFGLGHANALIYRDAGMPACGAGQPVSTVLLESMW